jgi:hypothetical protein
MSKVQTPPHKKLGAHNMAAQARRGRVFLPHRKYSVIAEIWRSSDNGEYLVYGLLVSERVTGRWRGLDAIHDITTVRRTADEMARAFNFRRLSPRHFREAVEDWLVYRA